LIKFTKKFNKYELILATHSVDIFNYFGITELHGLTKKEALSYKETPTDAYIMGMTNYAPKTKFPFLFININRLDGSFKDATKIMHETIHLSLLLHDWDVNNKEEQIVTDAEKYANEIINLLYKGK
jgi:hypothetical protein